jgi:hypothetical protein
MEKSEFDDRYYHIKNLLRPEKEPEKYLSDILTKISNLQFDIVDTSPFEKETMLEKTKTLFNEWQKLHNAAHKIDPLNYLNPNLLFSNNTEIIDLVENFNQQKYSKLIAAISSLNTKNHFFLRLIDNTPLAILKKAENDQYEKNVSCRYISLLIIGLQFRHFVMTGNYFKYRGPLETLCALSFKPGKNINSAVHELFHNSRQTYEILFDYEDKSMPNRVFNYLVGLDKNWTNKTPISGIKSEVFITHIREDIHSLTNYFQTSKL